MKRIVVTGILALMLPGVFAGPSFAQVQTGERLKDMSPMLYSNKKVVELRMDMRELWDEHVMFTREYVVSAIGGLEDTPAVADRLLRNQDEIGNAIAPYYGDAAGKKLAGLLREHILIAVDVVKAAKAGDTNSLNTAQTRWKTNATDIAAFLSSANPHWKSSDLQNMLYKHLELLTDQVQARLKKDWKAEIKAFDTGEDHMLMFADALTNGIALQFPNKFK